MSNIGKNRPSPLKNRIRPGDQVKLKKDGSLHTVVRVEKDGTMKFADFGVALRGEVIVVARAEVEGCFLSHNTKNPYGKIVADDDMFERLPPEINQGHLFEL
jgi:hypothetical protein